MLRIIFNFDWTMVITMAIVGMMESAIDDVVGMVAMGNRLVAAVVAVDVLAAVELLVAVIGVGI